MEDTERWGEVENRWNGNCPLSARLNRMYRADSPEHRVKVSAEIGEGYWQRMRPLPAAELVLCDVRFYENTVLSSREREDSTVIGFCLGEPISWHVEGKRGEVAMSSGEVSAFVSTNASNSCEYDAHRHFQGLILRINRQIVSQTMQYLPLDKTIKTLSENAGQFYNSKMTAEMKRTAHDIAYCPYEGDIKQIYLSGKVLELVALYLNESLQEKQAPLTAFSRTDLDALQRAKEILDANLLSPPGLTALARQVCLNEYKLKKGFKQLFGLPVHAYLIDRRLVAAYAMLEEGMLNITEAAYAVGFSKTGHFSEKFKRKYGVNPSEYFRHYGQKRD